MEALLSLAFDNLSSKDGLKIRKGIRQIEGLLAQICLPNPAPRAKEKRRPSTQVLSDSTVPMSLQQVAEDPAFREFFRLQESFEWNVSSQLITCLETLLGMPNGTQSNQLILSALDLLQGILLLHPPSRALFRREIFMMLLLDLLDATNPPAIQAQTLLVLVTALLATPESTRTFEQMDGLLTVASLFKSRGTSKEVKMKVVEFLYFYLMPETSSNPERPGHQRRPSKHVPIKAGPPGQVDVRSIRTTEEKQQMLGQYLSNVADLVEDLRENTLFAIAV
ncbi:hypothetical protein AAFC00_004852 [Neodothiora populina]|uniref:Cell division control protein 14 n=1 Tax=Neodothiora populina TaxID=2781224 RepID=A0ABR3P3D6_9PEZI